MSPSLWCHRQKIWRVSGCERYNHSKLSDAKTFQSLCFEKVVSNWHLVISFRFSVNIPDVPIALGAKHPLNIAEEEPILWSGSVAENLDPSGIASEETLMQALRKAHPWIS